ncbi:hypothetical protein ACHAWF_002597, partial [Thalassiosira exigua]
MRKTLQVTDFVVAAAAIACNGGAVSSFTAPSLSRAVRGSNRIRPSSFLRQSSGANDAQMAVNFVVNNYNYQDGNGKGNAMSMQMQGASGGYLSGLSSSSPPSRWHGTSSASSSDSAAATPLTTSIETTAMNLDLADLLASGVVAAAKRNGFAPIVVSVLDKQANLIVQKRMDGDVHAAFPEFSYAKAYTSVVFDTSSREFRDKYSTGNDPAKMAQVQSMMSISGKLAAFPGGVAVRNAEGTTIGAIGVSGAAGDED